MSLPHKGSDAAAIQAQAIRVVDSELAREMTIDAQMECHILRCSQPSTCVTDLLMCHVS